MPPETLDAIMADRGTSSPSERDDAPQISDAERAANPIGSAKRERDHAGRFAPKDDKDELGTAQQQKPQDQRRADDKPDGGDQPGGEQRRQGTVPQQALEAERRKRQERDDRIEELLRQNAELMTRSVQSQPAPQPLKPAQPPFVWQDPDGWMQHGVKSALDPVQQQQLQQQQQMEGMKLHYSQHFATQTHGKEAVDGAISALAELRQSSPREFQALEARVATSMDPVGDVVRWHKQQHALKEIGDDPAAYRERLRKELMAELQQQQGGELEDDATQQQPAPQQRPPVLPTSFAAQRSGAPRGGQGYGGPRALSDIMPRG